MWDPSSSDQGLNLLQWKGGVLTTGWQGRSVSTTMFVSVLFFFFNKTGSTHRPHPTLKPFMFKVREAPPLASLHLSLSPLLLRRRGFSCDHRGGGTGQVPCCPPVPFPLRGMCPCLREPHPCGKWTTPARDEQAQGEGLQSGSAGQERTSNAETQF